MEKKETEKSEEPVEANKEEKEKKESEEELKLKELEDKFLRLYAEFENFRKRTAKEQEGIAERAKASLLLKLLPVLDELELATVHTKDKGEKSNEKVGIEMIYKNMMKILTQEGLSEMDTLGKQFDPYYHEAVREADGEEGKVVEVIQKGYMFKGVVLRHAKVVVGKKKEEKRKEEKENKDDKVGG